LAIRRASCGLAISLQTSLLPSSSPFHIRHKQVQHAFVLLSDADQQTFLDAQRRMTATDHKPNVIQNDKGERRLKFQAGLLGFLYPPLDLTRRNFWSRTRCFQGSPRYKVL